MGLRNKLNKIQMELKAPKNQYNDYGNYKYRSCEDILEALKPLLKENSLMLILEDEPMNIGERYYIRATAKLYDLEANDGGCIYNSAYAREEENKKGMDASQITGACSSYARKYALNGLFLIDDVKDSDYTNNGKEEQKTEKKATEKQIKMINDLGLDLVKVYEYYEVECLEDLTIKQASEIIKAKTKKEANSNDWQKEQE